MPVHQQRAIGRTFAYLGWTLGVSGAVAGVLALDVAHDVTDGWFITSFVVSLGLLLAIAMGSDAFRLRTLRLLLTAFAASEGVFFGHVVERFELPVLAAAIVIAALVFMTMALWGLVTGRDLASLGAFLFWSLVAMVGCTVVAVAFGAAPMLLALAAAGVLLFALYTAHDVAWVMAESLDAPDAEAVERIAIDGAISLYLDLINLVVDVLRLFAQLSSWFDWS